MKRILGILAGLVLVAGCGAPAPSTATSPSTLAVSSVAPSGGMLLSDLGFKHAPTGFSVPATIQISENVDAYNNITVIAVSPSGKDFAAYLRQHLPSMGYEITADKNDSLLFRNATWQGAFTLSEGLAALTLRTDQEPAATATQS